MTTKSVFGIAVFLLVMSMFGYWRYQAASRNSNVTRIAIIQDASDSISFDCDRTSALVERSLRLSPATPGWITLFALGDATTANEPQWLGEFQLPITRRVIEGKQVEQRAREQLFTDIRKGCAQVKQTQKSPIFQGAKRGVEQLASVGASSDSRYLFIQTDGEETENALIVRALNQAPGAASKLPPPIQNAGIRVTFCGIAETVGAISDSDQRLSRKSKTRDSKRSDRSREIWLKLFTNPELVAFQPYCGKEN